MALVVQKFGGTSVADPERIREVADHVARTRRHGDDVVVVVSAMGKETDELHPPRRRRVARSGPGREMDMLITAGERKAMALLCMALHDLGVPADCFTGSQAGFITDTNHTNAKIVEVRPDRIRAALDAGRVPVVGGVAGRVDRPRRHVPRPGRLRHHRGGARPRPRRRRRASSTPTCRACSPPTRGSCPTPAAWRRSASTSCSR